MVGKGFERKWLEPEKRLVTIALQAMALVAAAAANVGVASAAGSTIFVNNVDDLYRAVNTTANAGANVVIARGEYLLEAADASGAPRPNGGRLEFQSNMSLYGVTGERDAVVIKLNPSRPPSFAVPAINRTGVIRVGRGINAIEWLKIEGNPNAAAAVETDLPGTSPTVVRIAHVMAKNSARGVDIRNVVTNAGRPIQADIEDSEFDNDGNPSTGIQGIRIANFPGADGGRIAVNMLRNHSHAHQLGCLVANNLANSASIAVRSDRDRFEDNGLGCFIAGGLSGAATGTANSDRIAFDAYGSQFSNNARTVFDPGVGPTFTDNGGLLVLGAQVNLTGAPNAASGNTVVVRLWDSAATGNLDDRNFTAFGARSELNPPALAGTGNRAVIELHGTSRSIAIVVTNSKPPDPNGTNTVTVLSIP